MIYYNKKHVSRGHFIIHGIRWKQRYSNFSKALAQLTEFLEQPSLNKFEVQGLIQCFEYTFELGWKTMKDYLEQDAEKLIRGTYFDMLKALHATLENYL